MLPSSNGNCARFKAHHTLLDTFKRELGPALLFQYKSCVMRVRRGVSVWFVPEVDLAITQYLRRRGN